MNPTFLVVPGLNGSGEGHWQRHWLDDHAEARLVEQDDWANPQAEQWLERLEQAIIANPGAIVVAHSLGSILTARLATSRVAPIVGGALLVAPADIERTSTLHARSYEFGSIPTDRFPFPALVAASRDDVYMTLDKAQVFARAWGAQLVDLGYVGHVNVASGFGRWPEGYQLARQVWDKSGDIPLPNLVQAAAE